MLPELVSRYEVRIFGLVSVSKFSGPYQDTRALKVRIFGEFPKKLENLSIFAQKVDFLSKKTLIFNSKFFPKNFQKNSLFLKEDFTVTEFF